MADAVLVIDSVKVRGALTVVDNFGGDGGVEDCLR